MGANNQVPDDEVILRHIPGGTTFQAQGPRITSKNFDLRAGEAGISVSRQAVTAPDQLMARIGDPAAGSRIAFATVAAVRALGLEVVPDPIADDPGHALILGVPVGLGGQSVRKQLSMTFRFVP